jgi:hypothetical protein
MEKDVKHYYQVIFYSKTELNGRNEPLCKGWCTFDTELNHDIENCTVEIRRAEKPNCDKYKDGEFPKCFIPCPPFYDICNRANLETEKCKKCFNEYGFVDYIE